MAVEPLCEESSSTIPESPRVTRPFHYLRRIGRLRKIDAGQTPGRASRARGHSAFCSRASRAERAIGEKIRDLLQFDPENVGMRAETEVLLFEASRSQLVREVIEPALTSGSIVIADRFFDSTSVYQGVARKLDAKFVAQLNRFAIGDCMPDITFVLDVDCATARERMLRRVRPVGAPDRMEQEPAEFYERVRAGISRTGESRARSA